MFKGFFKYQPLPVQVFAFAAIWFILQLIYLVFRPYIIKISGGGNYTLPEVLNGSAPTTLMWLNFFYQLFFFVLPVIIYLYLWSPRPYHTLGYFTPKKSQILLSLLIGTSFVFIFPILGTLITKLDIGSWADSLQADRERMEAVYFKDNTLEGLTRNILLLALVPAISEELFFRGILMRFVNSVFRNPIISSIAVAIIFAFMHFSIYNFMPIFLAGFLLGYIFFRTANLWLSTLVHFVYNAIQVVIAGIFPDQEQSLDGKTLLLMGILATSIALAWFFIHSLNRISNPLSFQWGMKDNDE